MEEIKLGNVKEEEDDEEFFCDACDDFPFFDCREAEPNKSSSCSSVTALNSDPYPGNLSVANLRRRRRATAVVSWDSNDAKSSVSSGENDVNPKVEKCEILPEINGVKEELQHLSQNSESTEQSKLSLSLKSKHCASGLLDEESVIYPKISEVVADPIEYDVKNSEINDTTFKQHDDGAKDKVCLEEKPVVIDAIHERIKDVVEDDTRREEIPAIADANCRGNGDYVEDNTHVRGNREANASFLLMFAGFVIRAIGFQLNVMIYLFMWPLWLIYSSYRIVTDPFRAVRRCRRCLVNRVVQLWGYAHGHISASLCDFLEEHKSFLRLGLKLGWGLLWSVYVCVVLVCLLVAAFVVGGILMKVMVEEPIKMKDILNFDYTELSPVAFVPVAEFPGAKCGLCSTGKPLDVKLGGVDGLPLKHKLQVTVSLNLPESDYNRNLGMFQVRVDFLGADGNVITSSRRPCMLRFTSNPIRLLLTFFKMAPLLTGYSSESQDVNNNFRGLTQGGMPITCLRVMIEQRAQFPAGAGIPEIYSASLSLESEQPFFKRILWYWRKTVFVWISMAIFTVELLIALICCTSIILPRVKLGVNSDGNGSQRDNGLTQR